ncbi:Hsp33 family molecular chaperone HslO [[Bacteroides] pectinophilus]|nr:Hsp33 family molecular chaperone HslO [[Bacteroides] pectinophilus]CDD57561.1 33 kDa chaperonin [Bacteroides pectinophilus CAG:437]
MNTISKNSDYIVRATAANHQIRAFAISSTNTIEEARQRHNTSPIATVALGRLMSAGAMMGTMMKGDDDIITIQIKGDGPIGGLTVTADAKANVKGYVNHPEVMLPLNSAGQLDVEKALGIGVLSVIKDIGLKEPYVGDTILVTSDVTQDITYYFATSEQVPTSVGLSVIMSKDNTVKSAGGFIIQLLPDASEEIISALEKKIKEVKNVTTMLEHGYTPEQMLEELLGEFGLDILDKIPTQFYCNCSKERMSRALISIGRKELSSLIEEGRTIEVNCHFCGSHYNFDVEELKDLLHKAVR